MAKCKDEGAMLSQEEFVERIAKEIEKDYGEGVLISGHEAIQDKRVVVPISPAMDIITSGGVEEGSWVGITGNPKSGKTSCALSIAANAQLPEFGGRPVYYDKVEGRLSINHLKGIRGLDLAPGKFHIIQSREGKILTAQDHLTILTNILRTVPGAFIIIDSISALCDEKEMTDGVGTETRGGGAKLFSQFCRLMNNVVPVHRSIVVGITHLISNTSGMGAQYVERAARMWQYQCDYQLRTIMRTAWKSGEKQIGLIIKWACNTSKLGPPGMSIDSYLRFGVGVDRLFEAVSLGVAGGLVKKSGSWLTMDFLQKPQHEALLEGEAPPKFQGAENLYRALLEKPAWARALEQEVLSLAGCLATSSGD